MSYNDLPYRLKLCFMHLGNFREDSTIDAWKLYLCWMAEGLLSLDDKREGETMTDVAERYLGELAQRSMVQVELQDDSFRSLSGRFRSCRLHDLMRDLCLSKAKMEDFLKVVDSRSHGNDFAAFMNSSTSKTRRLSIHGIEFAAFMNSSTSKTRRLSIHLGEDQDSDVYIPNEKNQATRNLRSLMLFGESKVGDSLISCIKEFKFLRVLEFKEVLFGENSLLEGISKLIHLRYLGFANCYNLKELPASIGDLQYLQALDLEGTIYEEIVIPNVLWKMKRLKHLHLPEKYEIKDGQKLRLDGLIELETLSKINTRFSEVKDLVESRNLCILDAIVKGEIENGNIVSDNEKTERNLKMVASISRYLNPTPSQLSKSVLSIINCNFDSEEGVSILGEVFRCMTLHSLDIKGHIVKLPECQQHLSSSLTTIILSGSEMEEDPMATLEKLPSLRVLMLLDNSYVGREMVCSARGFSQLRNLRMFMLPNLEKWHMDKGAMPNLSSLFIYACEKLEMVPEGLRFLSGLKEIMFGNMKDDFLDRVQVVGGKEGEDFYKVRHVPSIIIG